jgi:O-succinylbenzoate synthase
VAIERTIRRIRLSRSIVMEASKSMPTVVKTLDSVHLASAILIRQWREVDLHFATHDAQQATAARALGFVTLEA